MSEMVAYCGLLCNECLAYKATVADDMALREETAAQWSKMNNADIKPEDINCLGCDSDMLFGYCNMCEIRSCAREKGLKDCGKCGSFACAKVENVLKYAEGARERLSKK
jgi:hypothetical protein